jgi:hypothetical protein
MEIPYSRGPVGICVRHPFAESFVMGTSAFAPTTEEVWKPICEASPISEGRRFGNEVWLLLRQQAQCPIPAQAVDGEISPIQCEDRVDFVAFGKTNERRIR